jgi:Protein of unknown function (DUF3048) N-terminal domain/Protein of unknown function (DUF3048) C-terminal domain
MTCRCVTLMRMPDTTSPLVRGRRRRLLAVVGLPLVLTLALAACGGDDESPDEAASEPTDTTNTASAVTLNGQWPLTGEKVEGALPEHPVYVVKIDNTSASAPQIGLGSADLVVEELVEGGLTRLAVFFYQDVPDNVGPVRSMRASDIGIVKPAHATLIASGGGRKTIARLEVARVPTLTEGATGYARDDSRSAPYNLFMALSELAEAEDKKGTGPKQTYFEFGDASTFTGDIPVTRMSADFGAHTTEWTYNDKGWVRPNSYASEDDDFAADNVLMLQVKVGDAGYLDPAGNPVPETYFVGKGKGVLVHGDKAVRVVWKKGKRLSQLQLSTPQGKPVAVPTGRTWIELVPATTGEVRLRK